MMKPAQFLFLYFGIAALAVFLFIRFGGVINEWVSSTQMGMFDEVAETVPSQTVMQRRMAVRGAAMYGGFGRGGNVGSMAAISTETVKKELESNSSGMKELTAMSSETPSNAPVAIHGATVSVSALIDGVSVLLIHKNNARWYHCHWAAPGREKGSKDPTIFNGEEWLPDWQNGTIQNRFGLRNDNCKCYSSVYSDLNVQFPQKKFEVKINKIDVRGNVQVLMQPSKENDYVTAILFDDNQNGGSAWFDVELEVVIKQD